jgi:hypothetical protein
MAAGRRPWTELPMDRPLVTLPMGWNGYGLGWPGVALLLAGYGLDMGCSGHGLTTGSSGNGMSWP